MGRDIFVRSENASKCAEDTHSDISLSIGLLKSREQNFDTPPFDPFAGAFVRSFCAKYFKLTSLMSIAASQLHHAPIHTCSCTTAAPRTHSCLIFYSCIIAALSRHPGLHLHYAGIHACICTTQASIPAAAPRTRPCPQLHHSTSHPSVPAAATAALCNRNVAAPRTHHCLQLHHRYPVRPTM